jgi:hypothetical protein
MVRQNKKAHDGSKTVVGIFAWLPVCRSADGNFLAPFIGRQEKIAPQK